MTLALVEMATQGWGLVLDEEDKPLPFEPVTLTTLDGSAASVYLTETDTTPTAIQLLSRADATLPGWVKTGAYNMTVRETTRRVQAIAAEDVLTIGSGIANSVSHGSSAATARPSTAGPVIWIGSVEPSNAVDSDLWVDTSL